MILNCRGQLLDLSEPKVMGILNLTPDSFYDGGVYNSPDRWRHRIEQMVKENVDIIDIGAASSRPGSEILSMDTELKRLEGVVPFIRKEFPHIPISIDTVHSQVLLRMAEEGAHIHNDISAGEIDDKIFTTVKDYKLAYILMHMHGTPTSMQNKPEYKNVTNEILTFFIKKLDLLRQKEIYDIILDPGFGFGKSIDHNYKLFKELSVFRILNKPLLIGVSRKSMLYKLFDTSPNDVLPVTSALHQLALKNGAKILRAHDVKEAKRCVQLHMIIERQ